MKRVIHTSADFDYADNLVFSPGAVAQAQAALRGGCTVVTDTRMAYSGINQRNLSKLNSAKACYIDAPEVAERAKAQGVTRAAVAMQLAAEQPETAFCRWQRANCAVGLARFGFGRQAATGFGGWRAGWFC